MTEPTSESEDRATELANRLAEATDRIVPLLEEGEGLSSEDEDAVGDELAEFAEVAREADFEAFLRAAGFEDLPDDPEPADLPGLVGEADEEEVDTVHRLLGLRDLADEWAELESDERHERLRDLFEGVSADSGVSEPVDSADEGSTAEPDETAEAEEPGDEAEAEDEEQSGGTASFVDRLRDAADQLSETAAESAADETEAAADGVTSDDEAEEAEAEEAEEAEDEAEPDEDDESGRKSRSRSRRGRYSSMPSKRPDMQGVGRKSTMPRRKRN